MPTFDEMNGDARTGSVRAAYAQLRTWLDATSAEHLTARRAQAEHFFRRIGITFAVYGKAEAGERLIPFDIIPRVLAQAEWAKIEVGLRQRAEVLNRLLQDLYGPQEVVRAGVLPAELIHRNPQFALEMVGVHPPHDVWTHILGVDLVRTAEDRFYVLEDNCRTPSGVSYMLENREVMMRLFPELFAAHHVAPVETYIDTLSATLRSVAPIGREEDPVVVVLTPGRFNSAYYEHSFLADKLGVELVEGADLIVRDDGVYKRTTEGLRRVDVIYRRVDDDFLDPLVFRSDSYVGVPGLMSAYLSGQVTVVNAVGTGIADDKAMCSYMPEIIRFYTGAEPLLDNVPTWRCREPDALAYTLDRLSELVVKEVNGSGGYGMLVGPAATREELDTFAARVRAAPEGFIAQPTLALSTCPTFVDEGAVAPRHVDLRPFVLTGADGVRITPGGLTRVALNEGSLVVNSSQGGGTKDTWVLDG